MKYLSFALITLFLVSCQENNPPKAAVIENDTIHITKPDLEKRVDSQKDTNEYAEFLQNEYPYPSEGRQILKLGKGDLNLDGLDDYVIIWKHTEEDDCDCSTYGIEGCVTCCRNRYLEILLHFPAERELPHSLEDYYTEGRSEKILYKKCSNLDRDPLKELKLGKGYFELTQVIRGISKEERTIRFEFEPISNKWKLVKDQREYVSPRDTTHSQLEQYTINDSASVSLEVFDVLKNKSK